MQAYCVKCRAKREMKDAKAVIMKNGKPTAQGVCPTCGTRMSISCHRGWLLCHPPSTFLARAGVVDTSASSLAAKT